MGVRALTAQLAHAGLAASALSIVELAALIRSYSSLGVVCGDTDGTAPAMRRIGFDRLEIDGWHHRAWWVAAWPRTPVRFGWLQPLLDAAPAGAARTLAVHYQPTPAGVALRRARAARTKVAVDRVNRSRLGLLDSVIESRAGEQAGQRETEIVAGYGEHRIAAVLTVSAPTLAELDSASTAVTAAAAVADIDLRVAYGRQDQAWAAAMPLCRLRLGAS
jgi:hypothetical protein